MRSLFHYASYEAPAHADHIQRYSHKLVSFLERTEIEALLATPDQTSWSGRRDHALLLVAIQTGLRVSETSSHPLHGERTEVTLHTVDEAGGDSQRLS